MSLKLYEILCPDGYVKNGYNKSKLSTIFANSMNSGFIAPNKDFTHIDDSEGDKVAMFDYQTYPSKSVFEIHLDTNCSPLHLSKETITYLEAYKRTGQLIDVVIITSEGKTLSEEEQSVVNNISNNITYK